jgi:hypothetical protein
MKKLIFTVVGALFLLVSCQSDDLQIDDAAKPDKATKVEKDFKIKNYAGEIFVDFDPGDPDAGIPPSGTGAFEQIGGGIASHIGQFTEYNTANIFDFPGTFEGMFIAANGDEIHFGSRGFQCDGNYEFGEECPAGTPVILYYVIDGGTGRFEGAIGEFEINGKFTPFGPYTGATGTGWIKY